MEIAKKDDKIRPREDRQHEPLLMSPGGSIRKMIATNDGSEKEKEKENQNEEEMGEKKEKEKEKEKEKKSTTTSAQPEAFVVKPSIAETIAASLEKLAVATESLNQLDITPDGSASGQGSEGQSSTSSPTLLHSKSSPSLPVAPPPTTIKHSNTNEITPLKTPSQYTPNFTNLQTSVTPMENYWLAATPSPTSSSISSPNKTMFHPNNDGHNKQMTRELFGGAITCILNEKYLDVSYLRQVPDNQEVFMHKDSNSTILVELLEYQECVRTDQAARYFFDDLCSANEASQAEILSCSVSKDNKLLMPRLKDSFPRCMLIGKQLVKQLNPYCQSPSSSSTESSPSENESSTSPNKTAATAAPEVVNIMMILVRLKTVNTDLMISLNTTDDLSVDGCDNILQCFLPRNDDHEFCSVFNTNTNVNDVRTCEGIDQNIDEGIIQKQKQPDMEQALSPDNNLMSLSKSPSDHFRTVLESFEILDWSLFV